MMEEGLVAWLTGSLATDRVRWFGFDRAGAGVQVALTKISPGRSYTHDGVVPMQRPRVRFDIRGDDAMAVMVMARQVTEVMEAGADVDTVRFHPAQLDAERPIDLGEQPGGATLYQQQLEFLFYVEEIEQ